MQRTGSKNPAKPSLRERKKLATRNALVATARRLFAEKGYENTTLEEICEEVQIHVTTFFSYFASKEELAFARTLEMLDMFREGLRNKPDDVDAMTYWWRFNNEFSLRARTEEGTIMLRMDSVPALRSRYASIVRQYEEEMAIAFAREAGVDPETDLYSRLRAAALLAATLASARWYIATFGIEPRTADTDHFTKQVLASFPSRAVIDEECRRFSKVVHAHARRGSPAPRTQLPKRRRS